MLLPIISIVFGAVVLVELIICLVGGISAADIMYYLCRPFGIEVSMAVGLLVRIVLIFCAGGALLYGIGYFAH